MNSIWLITSELANQSTPKVLFTCVVYTKDRLFAGLEIRVVKNCDQGLLIVLPEVADREQHLFISSSLPNHFYNCRLFPHTSRERYRDLDQSVFSQSLNQIAGLVIEKLSQFFICILVGASVG